MLSTHDFHYDLPDSLIAQEPARPRDAARLMLIKRDSGKITHHHIFDLPSLLDSQWALVANNTKVFPARLHGQKRTGGKVEVLLLHPLGNSQYTCITRPGLPTHTIVSFDHNLTATVKEGSTSETREVTIQFNEPEGQLRTSLSEIGSMPTPPYIKKMLENIDDYQTIYAKYGFSAAAPTAGLHFTPELLSKIQREHPWHEITLDVGLGTFLPVKVDDVEAHHMHSENFTITPEVAASLNKSRESHKLLAIGTTTTRALESSSTDDGKVIPTSADTNIFIYPPYRYKSIDGLMTNFHLPESTLLMMVSAFICAPNTSHPFTSFADSLLGEAYRIAVAEKYRFFSFGDAMLII